MRSLVHRGIIYFVHPALDGPSPGDSSVDQLGLQALCRHPAIDGQGGFGFPSRREEIEFIGEITPIIGGKALLRQA